MMKNSALIIFQKNAELGKVKTRLAKDLGDQKALAIYEKLCDITHQVCSQLNVEKYVYYSSFVPDNKPQGPTYRMRLQSGENLGDRMLNAFEDLFQSNFQKLIIIGTDCPEISAELIQKAFDQLDSKDVVIGPAEDGGYYLLGMNKLISSLFKGISWSSEMVFDQTKSIIEAKKLTYYLLPMLSDIDRLEDWEKMKSLFTSTYE